MSHRSLLPLFATLGLLGFACSDNEGDAPTPPGDTTEESTPTTPHTHDAGAQPDAASLDETTANETTTDEPAGDEAGPSETPEHHADASESIDAGADGEISFFQDVLPIYAERCVHCHEPGGIAPFALDNYDDARKWANASLSAIQARTMPPWLTKADGTCNHFQDSAWLSDSEIDTVRQWVDQGILEGKTRSIDAKPGETLDATLTLATPVYTPHAAGGDYARYDDYHCFIVDAADGLDQFLTSYEVIPGNPALVHHVVLMTVDPNMVVTEDGKTNRDLIEAMDAKSPDVEGWTCFGAAGDGVAVSGNPVVWAPGQGVLRYPDKTGLFLDSREQLVIQVHYNLSNPELAGASDQTRIALHLEPEVERPGQFVLPDGLLSTLFEGEPATLPPGQADYAYSWAMPLSEPLEEAGVEAFDVYGVFPHMHELGTSMSVTFTREGEADTCVADVPRWDFDWQLFYRFEEPLVVTADQTLEVTCHFDTRGREEPTLPGWGTQNEMCLAGLFMVPHAAP